MVILEIFPGFNKDSVYCVVCFEPLMESGFSCQVAVCVSFGNVILIDIGEEDFPIVSSDIVYLFTDVSDELIKLECSSISSNIAARSFKIMRQDGSEVM